MQNSLHEQLERATRCGYQPAVDEDPQVLALHESWRSFSQLCQASQPQDRLDECQVARLLAAATKQDVQLARRSPRTLARAIVVLAASLLLVASLVALSRKTSSQAVTGRSSSHTAAKQASSNHPTEEPANTNIAADTQQDAAADAELQWDDALDDSLEDLQLELLAVSRGKREPTSRAALARDDLYQWDEQFDDSSL